MSRAGFGGVDIPSIMRERLQKVFDGSTSVHLSSFDLEDSGSRQKILSPSFYEARRTIRSLLKFGSWQKKWMSGLIMKLLVQ